MMTMGNSEANGQHFSPKARVLLTVYPLITFWLECVAIENLLSRSECRRRILSLKNKRANVGENV
jgi:hypothetical protein